MNRDDELLAGLRDAAREDRARANGEAEHERVLDDAAETRILARLAPLVPQAAPAPAPILLRRRVPRRGGVVAAFFTVAVAAASVLVPLARTVGGDVPM